MPVITRFYGILIKMYFSEHGIPHFHAVYGEYNGVFKIQTLEMIEGDLPLRAQKMVKNWANCLIELKIKPRRIKIEKPFEFESRLDIKDKGITLI